MFQVNLLIILATIPAVLIIPIIVLFLIFLSKYIKTHHKMFGYLAALFLFYLISNNLQFFQLFAANQEIAEFYFIIAEISELLVLYIFILLFEIFYKNKQFSYRQTIITIFVFTIIGGLISNPTLETTAISTGYLVSIQRFSSIMIFEFIFHIIAMVFLLIILIKSRKSAWAPKQKKLITWLLIGTLIGVLLPSLPNFSPGQSLAVNQLNSTIMYLLQSIPQNIGILIVGISFLRVSKNPWLLQRQRVYFLVVYSHEGISLYSKTFSKEITPDDTVLLAGAFSAVTSLIGDCTKSAGNVKSILLEGKQLRIISQKRFISALLLDYTTQASEWAHKNFTLEFEKKFSAELANFNGEVSLFNSAELIIKQYFT